MNRPFKILVADDEKPVAAGLQGQLDALGYDVVAVVHDGHHAIEVCRRSLPDLVLMDIEMPGLDGLSAARQIARDPGTPVIILTGRTDEEVIRRCHQLCAYYVPKCPDVWQRLEPLIHELLGLEPASD